MKCQISRNVKFHEISNVICSGPTISEWSGFWRQQTIEVLKNLRNEQIPYGHTGSTFCHKMEQECYGKFYPDIPGSASLNILPRMYISKY